jgi:hypothetical protein
MPLPQQAYYTKESSMRRLVLGLCCLAFSTVAAAQGSSASLFGLVTSPDGKPVANAPVRATDADGKVVGRGVTASDGQYTIVSILPGVYTVGVAMPCCVIASFTQSGVTVSDGQKLRFDVHLKPGTSQNTLGDDPGVIANALRNRSRVEGKPVPRSSNGKPDFAGLWLINADRYPEAPSPLPWAAAIAKQRNDTDAVPPSARCLPANVPTPLGGGSPFVTKVLHDPRLLVLLLEGSPGFRQIFLDGRSHAADPNPTWLGHSIGRWEGDTLVVDTVGYNDQSWLMNSLPHTEMLHIVERFQRPDFGHLNVQVTYEDPGTLTKPVVRNAVWDLATEDDVLEFVCENNKEGVAAQNDARGVR